MQYKKLIKQICIRNRCHDIRSEDELGKVKVTHKYLNREKVGVSMYSVHHQKEKLKPLLNICL